LSRWFFLDECSNMDPDDIKKYISSRRFKPKEFWHQVNSMYNTLKELRLSIIREADQVENTRGGDTTMRGLAWLPPEAREMFSLIDSAKVLGNIGKAYRLARDLRDELRATSETGRL